MVFVATEDNEKWWCMDSKVLGIVRAMSVLKWKFQPSHRGASWEKAIKARRKDVLYALKESPSLHAKLNDPEWMDVIWSKAVAIAANETGLDCFPDESIWTVAEILSPDFWLS